MVTVDLAPFVFDADDNQDLSSLTIVDTPFLGSVEIVGDGLVKYTSFGEPGEDFFTYKIFDTLGAESNVARVNINIEFFLG